MPLSEVLFDFYDRLKSYSRGYASFDYEVIDMRETDLVKISQIICRPTSVVSFLYLHELSLTARQIQPYLPNSFRKITCKC